MTLLALGVALFVGVHLVPTAASLRDRLIARLGFNGYRGLFSLLTTAGLVLIVVGKKASPFVHLWGPPSWSATALVVGMPFAFILLAAAYIPSNFKRRTRHPMLWAVTIWAGLHLLGNGDLASLILFGGIGAFALFDMWSATRRGAQLSETVLPRWRDLVPVVVGLLAYFVFLYHHDVLFGPSVVGSLNALLGR